MSIPINEQQQKYWREGGNFIISARLDSDGVAATRDPGDSVGRSLVEGGGGSSHEDQDVDSEDEIGDWIYRESHTAKARADESRSASIETKSAITGATKLHTTEEKKQNQTPWMVPQRMIPAEVDNRAAPPKRLRKKCSHKGCTNQFVSGGVCVRHGAKRKTCSHDGCTNQVQLGGVCMRHGAKLKKCSHDGCTHREVRGGVCVRHGAKRKTCSHDGCTNQARGRGICVRHGAKLKKCSHDGCSNQARKGGICVRHGAKRKRKKCSHDGCTNHIVRGGVCVRHGAKRKECRERGGHAVKVVTERVANEV